MPVDTRGRYYADEEARPDADLASGTRTASGTGAAFATHEALAFEATLAVTAATGTLDVRLETTVDGANWDTVAAFPQAAAPLTRGKVFGPLGDQCRWAWTIGGATPSFTFATTVRQDH